MMPMYGSCPQGFVIRAEYICGYVIRHRQGLYRLIPANKNSNPREHEKHIIIYEMKKSINIMHVVK